MASRFFFTLIEAHWLSRSRICAYGLAFALGQFCLFSFLALKYFGIFPGDSLRVASDFLVFYAAGRLENLGDPGLVYHLPALFAEEATVRGAGADVVVFPYPPVILLICGVLGRLPFYLAWAVWAFGSLALWVVSLQLVTRCRLATLLLATFPTMFTNLYIGQTAFLNAGLLGLGLRLLERRPAMAGLVLGTLCYKPHFLILVPLVLLAGRSWRALAALAVSTGMIMGASVAISGWASWIAYLGFIPEMAQATIRGDYGYWAYTTPFAAIRTLGGSIAWAQSIQLALTIAVATISALIWASRAAFASKATVLVGATLLAVPVMASYDLTLATVAIAWIVRDQERVGYPGWVKLVLMLDWAIAFAGLMLARDLGIPLSPVIGLSMVGIGVMRAMADCATAEPRRSAVTSYPG